VPTCTLPRAHDPDVPFGPNVERVRRAILVGSYKAAVAAENWAAARELYPSVFIEDFLDRLNAAQQAPADRSRSRQERPPTLPGDVGA